MQRGKRIPLRERFFQNLEKEESIDHTMINSTENERSPVHENISNDNPTITTPALRNRGHGSRRSSRKRFFQELDNQGTSITSDNMMDTGTTMNTETFEDEHANRMNSLAESVDRTWLSLIEIERKSAAGNLSNDNRIGNNVQNLATLGQAQYQKQRQGVIIEYKDFGDNTYQCVYRNAYFWRDEKNSRGVYIGCCKHGQIHLEEEAGDILVFLTYKDEIEFVERLVKEKLKQLPENNQKLVAVPLFSSHPSEQQMRAFTPACPGVRKVVLATNIAETSVTIPGIKYVIDTGFVTKHFYNPTKGLEALIVVPISKAHALQRSERAGRERPGLYPENEFWTLEDSKKPDIKRCDLTNAILQLKALGVHDITRFDFIEKPSG